MKSFRQASDSAGYIKGPVLQSIKNLQTAILQMSLFFGEVHVHIEAYTEEAERAETKRAKAQQLKRLKLHFEKMQDPAKELTKLCTDFLIAVPHIEDELKRLNPSECHQPAHIQVRGPASYLVR